MRCLTLNELDSNAFLTRNLLQMLCHICHNCNLCLLHELKFYDLSNECFCHKMHYIGVTFKVFLCRTFVFEIIWSIMDSQMLFQIRICKERLVTKVTFMLFCRSMNPIFVSLQVRFLSEFFRTNITFHIDVIGIIIRCTNMF